MSSKVNTLNIAIVQADLAWKDKKTNLYNFDNWFKKNTKQTDLIVLPEMFATGFVTEPQDIAENMQGEIITWMVKQALQYNCAITGSVVIEENAKYFNRLIWVNRHGEISTYDKRHLFSYGGEHENFSSGDKKLIVELNGWKICPLVCYDLRFPVWAKNNYQNDTYQYDVLIYIANWPSVRSYAFRQLLIARAIENQSFVIGVNRVGIDGKGLYYQGDSTVLDYQGNPIFDMKPDLEGIENVSLSYENLQKARKDFPVGMDWDIFQIE